MGRFGRKVFIGQSGDPLHVVLLSLQGVYLLFFSKIFGRDASSFLTYNAIKIEILGDKDGKRNIY